VEFLDRVWLEAAASVQSDLDSATRDEAREIFVAEAARTTLADRIGPAVVVLRCGAVLRGSLVESRAQTVPEGFVAIRTDESRYLLVNASSIVAISGTAPRLSEEGSRSTRAGSLLREAWSLGQVVRVLLADGRWLVGTIGFVGADHVDIDAADGRWTVPIPSAEAWDLALPA
jgi:hypothetical protein